MSETRVFSFSKDLKPLHIEILEQKIHVRFEQQPQAQTNFNNLKDKKNS